MIRSKKQSIAIVVLIILQVLVMIYWGMQKNGYHVDEMYSYGLANSYYTPFIQQLEGYGEEWITSERIADFLEVTEDDRFAYGSVVYNQTQDVHPPIWYILFHTVCTFSVGVFSKWQGIILNLICFVGIDIILYLLTKRLLDQKCALLAVFIWGFSIGAINTVTFIRMYALLSAWVMLFLYAHSLLFSESQLSKNKLSYRNLAFLMVTTILGTLTQYYFLVFAFFVCGLWCLYLLLRRKWKILIQYACGELLAVLMSVVIYPALLRHMFGGYRGEAAFSALENNDSCIEYLKTYLSLFSHSVCWGCLKIFGILAIIWILVWGFQHFYMKLSLKYDCTTRKLRIVGERCNHIDLQWTLPSCAPFLLVLVLSSCAFLLMIARIAPYREDRYIMLLFPIAAIYSSALAMAISSKIIYKCGFSLAIIVCLLLTMFSWKVGTYHYLYTGASERTEITEQYHLLPVVALLSKDYRGATLANELMEHPATFFCLESDLSPLQTRLQEQNLSGGFLLYTESGEDTQNLENIQKLFASPLNFEKLTGYRGNIYLVEGA